MNSECLKCGYSITEPICASCVVDEVKTWAYDQRIKKGVLKQIDSELNELVGHVEQMDYVMVPSSSSDQFSMVECKQCRDELHRMCFYCVTNYASDLIRESVEDESLEQFYSFMNLVAVWT